MCSLTIPKAFYPWQMKDIALYCKWDTSTPQKTEFTTLIVGCLGINIQQFEMYVLLNYAQISLCVVNVGLS